MDLTILKKKISSYRTPKGRITSVPDELLGEILHAWEQWTGAPSGFYKFLDVDYRKMGSLMGRAKRLKREGAFDGIDFAEVNVVDDDSVAPVSLTTGVIGIELFWKNKYPIRFSHLDDLFRFLDKYEKIINPAAAEAPTEFDEAA